MRVIRILLTNPDPLRLTRVIYLHKLTQAADIDIKSRFIVSQVALGANDSIENWKEITDAEAAAIEEEIRAAHEAPAV